MSVNFLSAKSFGYGALARSSKVCAAALAVFVGLSGGVSAETVTIAALGDSLTHGYGLPAGQGFVPQLQAWLDANGADAKILNAGVSGDTTAGGLSRVDWTLTDDVDAMIVELGGNDLLRGVDPDVSRQNLSGILSAAQAKEVDVLLVGIEGTANFGADYKQRFDAMYPDLAQEFGTLYYPNFFEGIAAGGVTPETLRNFMQPDGIHPNAEGVKLIIAAIGPSVLELVNAAQ
ncbi:arylesterase [Donghicola mangrovi]|uniref:Arylesterase n=1 Tax=Donghicola mangrovi TaxID=2729614 RepID=A0A850Q5E1_9RHOB|nr:arylesterase [Donghicola mangrovi]NVO24937.1 arylesterase [Donghicola mangrovi]